MDMDVMFLEKFRINMVIFTDGPNITDSGLCRLFHDVSEFSRQHHTALARHQIHLNL